MRFFELSNPALKVSQPNDEIKTLIRSKLKIRLNIGGVEFTSYVLSAAAKENEIFWGETFLFEDIPSANSHITITLIRNEDEEMLRF